MASARDIHATGHASDHHACGLNHAYARASPLFCGRSFHLVWMVNAVQLVCCLPECFIEPLEIGRKPRPTECCLGLHRTAHAMLLACVTTHNTSVGRSSLKTTYYTGSARTPVNCCNTHTILLRRSENSYTLPCATIATLLTSISLSSTAPPN